MLLNIAGSSEDSTTGMPWFMITGRGCMGIDEVRRYHFLSQGKAPRQHTKNLPILHFYQKIKIN